MKGKNKVIMKFKYNINLLIRSFVFLLLVPHFALCQSHIEHTFYSEIPNPESLNAFEQKTKQKVIDFYNYVEIISDTYYNQTLRKHSLDLALKLFESNECIISGDDLKMIFGIIESDKYPIMEFLNTILNNNLTIVKTPITNLKIDQHLHKLDQQTYSGMITFNLTNAKIDAKNNSKAENIFSKKVGVILKKTEVPFNDESKLIWRVFLADIE